MSLLSLMSDAKHQGYMGSPPKRAVPYDNCIECGRGTRSHVLKPPSYESYEEEIMVGQADVHATKQWAEFDTVEKWEMSEGPTVMCHSCWLEVKEKTLKFVKKNLPTWIESPMSNTQRIKSFLGQWKEFEFGVQHPVDEEANKLVADLKESVRRSARGE